MTKHKQLTEALKSALQGLDEETVLTYFRFTM
jgi:hypothetical protein